MSADPNDADRQLSNESFLDVLKTIEEVVGAHGMDALLRQADLVQYLHNYPPANREHGGHRAVYVTQLSQAVVQLYGARGYRAILFRMGATQAKHALEQRGALASTVRFALRPVPAKMKVKTVLETVSREINAQEGRRTCVTEDGGSVYYEDPTCLYCIGVQGDQGLCYSVDGFLHTFIEWILENRDFKVEEFMCKARGDSACKFRVTLNG